MTDMVAFMHICWPDSIRIQKCLLQSVFCFDFSQKALFKVPKVCNTNFLIVNDPRPYALFRKFIRFGSRNLSLNFNILTKPCFRISTKIQRQKYQQNISSKRLTKLQLQNLA